MRLHRLLGEAQGAGDLRVRQAGRDMQQDLVLSRRQPVKLGGDGSLA